MKFLLFLLILLSLPACSLFDTNDGNVTARTAGHEVILRNDTSERLYYFVVGRGLATRINWAQSLDRTHSVVAGAERRIPYDEIAQEEEGENKALVYWWHAEREREAEKPGKLNQFVIALR